MNNLATYRYRIGCYYGKASQRSSLGKSPNHNTPSRSGTCKRWQKKFKRKFVSYHRLKYPKQRLKILHVLVLVLIVISIFQFGVLGRIRSQHALSMNDSMSTSCFSHPRQLYIMSELFWRDDSVKSLSHYCSTGDLLCVHNTMSTFNNNKCVMKVFKRSGKMTKPIGQHPKHSDMRYYFDYYRGIYQPLNIFEQCVFKELELQDLSSTDGTTRLNNIHRTFLNAAFDSCYECGSRGTGTCYYLLGNQGMHMINGNPRTKISPGEAHLRSRTINLINNHAEESVGFITVGEGSGTGFRVCDTYLMSAFHVFRDKIEDYIDQIIFHLRAQSGISNDDLLRKAKSALEVDITVDGTQSFNEKARCILRSFLDETANDTERLTARLANIMDTGPLITRLRDEWKQNCLVDFITHGRFYVDWKIIFGSREIDIIIVDLYPIHKNQNYPRGMLLDERYRQHGGIQLIRYIHRNPPEIIVDQNCKVYNSDNELKKAVDKAISWWERNFPREEEVIFSEEYKDCCKAIDKETGRVILKSSESFIPGSSGSPVIYMFNKDGIPVVEMIYQGGYPPFYYKQGSRRFQSVDVDRICFFGRATTMKRLADMLIKYQKIELKKLLFSIGCITEPKCIRREDAMTENVRGWEEAETYFFETEVSKVILNRISDDQCHSLSVIGVPGSGKTSAIRHAALHLQNEKGFTIYPILESRLFVEKFNMYFNRDRKQVFVFDDPVGSYSIDMNMVHLWDDQNENIEQCLSKNTKFIFSLRKQADQHENLKYNSYIFNIKARIIDLTSPEHCLGINDMNGMLKHLLKKRKLPFSEETLSIVADSNEVISRCFPLLCKVFCEEQTLREHPGKFFHDPFPALIQIFRKIKSHNKHQYCGLLMCAVFEDKSMDGIFQDNALETDIEQCRNAILDEMHLTKTDLKDIKYELEAIDNVYVNHIENRFSFVHSIFKDIVIFLYNNPDFVFKYGSSQLIKDRIRLDMPLNNDDRFVLVYKSFPYVKKLAARLIEDLWSQPEAGFIYLANNYLIDERRLFSCIQKKLDTKMLFQLPIFKLFYKKRRSFIKLMKNDHFYLHMSVLSGSLELTKFLLRILGEVSQYKMIVHNACRAPSNNLEIVKLLVQHGAVIHHLTPTSESVFHYIINYTKTQYLELSEYFLEKSVSVHTENKKGESLLHFTAKYDTDYNNTLAKQFISHGARVDVVDKDGQSLLHYTARFDTANNVKLARLFVSHGAPLIVKDNEGRTILHYIAGYGTEQQLTLAELLINHGSPLNVVDNEGRSVLHYTAGYGTGHRVELAELFINHGAHLDVVDNVGQSLLHYTARYGNENSIKLAELFTNHDAPLRKVDREGQSILHYTVRYEKDHQVKLAEFFINVGANFNAVDNAGKSLLHYTVCYENKNSVTLAEIFLNHGARINVEDDKGLSVLHYTACFKTENQIKLAELFINHGAALDRVDSKGLSILHYTAGYGTGNRVKLAELFINAGARLDNVDNEGQSLLHYTARYGNENSVKLAELFIECGVNMSVVDKLGQSLLHCIARYGNKNSVKLAKLFIFNGAPLNVVDNEGLSLLHYTAGFETENQIELAELFIYHGACLDVVDNKGLSVLHYTAGCGTKNRIKLAELLIKRGAYLDAVDNEGQSILHYTARYGNVSSLKLAELLINYGTSINILDKNGQSILHYTARYDRENKLKLAELFIKHGASLYVLDNDGQSVLHLTMQHETEHNKNLAKLLIKVLNENLCE